MKEEITSEITNFPVESHKGMLKLLKAETGENGREEDKNDLQSETKKFSTPAKLVRINSTRNNDAIYKS